MGCMANEIDEHREDTREQDSIDEMKKWNKGGTRLQAALIINAVGVLADWGVVGFQLR
jgi:predicted negative regulator of RcsB-dependent stress response